MLNRAPLKGHCYSCAFFTQIKQVVGYCIALGVMIEKSDSNVAILDTIDTLRAMKVSEEQEIISPLIVQAFFSCPLYDDKEESQKVL